MQVKGQPTADLLRGADRVDAALRLAETPVATFHGVARRTEQLVVQKQQRLVQRRTLQFVQGPAQTLETPHPRPQLAQLLQRRDCAAAPVEQLVDLGHYPSQSPQLRL